MASDVGIGDAETAFLDVTPAAVDTAATLTVTPPDGEPFDVTVSGGSITGTGDAATQRWTADGPVVYDRPGRWVLHWQVTGTGEGAEHAEVYVVASPVAGGPTWTPGRSRVANYLPGRTLVRQAGANVPAWTFDSTTNPPGVVVDRLIADAVAWVQTVTGPIHDSLGEAAAACAAIFAASNVELGYPDRDSGVKTTGRSVAEDLYRRALALRDDLVRANASAGEPPVDAGSQLLPSFAFPAPVPWGDLLL